MVACPMIQVGDVHWLSLVVNEDMRLAGCISVSALCSVLHKRDIPSGLLTVKCSDNHWRAPVPVTLWNAISSPTLTKSRYCQSPMSTQSPSEC